MRVAIVGAGLAGSRCAETLRGEGFDGEVVVYGEEPHPPYERPALSKELLAGTRLDVLLRPLGHWDELGIELRLGTRVDDLDAVDADAVVIATGARARRFRGCEEAPVLRTLDDAVALRGRLASGGRLVVIGAGFVGAEVASTPVGHGVEVVLPEIGAILADRFRRHGVDLRLGARVERAGPYAVELAGGEQIEAGAVLLAAGSEPATPGIETDACGRTPRPGVYACGDVAAWAGVRTEHWTDAAAQGAAVARTILGDPRPHVAPPYFWSDQFGMRLQQVGRAESWARVELDGTPDEFTARYLDASGRPLAVLLANRPAEAAAARRELAA